MLTLILILLLTWAVLMAFLVGFTVWFQGYIYTEPTTGILWRGPAAGTAVMAALVLWVVLDSRWPGGFRPLHDFNPSTTEQFTELRVPAEGGREEVYKLVSGASRMGGARYYRDGVRTNPQLPSRPRQILVTRDDEKLVFEPDRDANGKFKPGPDGVLRYRARDAGGREVVMEDRYPGQVTRLRAGSLLGNLLVNFLFLAAWFLALWLILAFQWHHALGLALAFWAGLILLLLPPVLDRAEAVSRARAAGQSAQEIAPGRPGRAA